MFSGVWLWFLHWTGTDNTGGEIYAFWSGFGSDIGEVVIIGGIVQMYRKHTCHIKGCWRLQRHAVAGTEHIVCRKHHPRASIRDGLTYEDVLADHRRANS
jgi:hypothetical protein